MRNQRWTGGGGDARPGCCDRHYDSGRKTKTALQEASRQEEAGSQET
jgi:hypothetical protein